MTVTPRQRGSDVARIFDQAVFLIAVGLQEKDAAYEADPHAYPYSSNFRLGLNEFAALCAQHAGENAAALLDGLSESRFIRAYCTKPIAEWTKDWSEEGQAAIDAAETHDLEALAVVDGDFFSPTDECLDLTFNAETDTLGAYQERMVYEYLRGGTQEQYVVGRRLLSRHPLLRFDEFLAIQKGRKDLSSDPLDQGEAAAVDRDWISELLEMAYEEAPDGLKICPRCGWTMSLRGSQPYCSSFLCRSPLPRYAGLANVPHSASRLKRGVMHYICDPGGLELALAEKTLELGLPFEMWPQKDACDVLVTLPNGRRLALDAKAYGSPRQLARQIEHDQTADVLGANEVIYVIPDNLAARKPGYCEECDYSLRDRPDYSCRTFKDLVDRLTAANKEANDGR